MDLKQVKENIATHLGKQRGLITRTYNEIERKKTEEGLTDYWTLVFQKISSNA